MNTVGKTFLRIRIFHAEAIKKRLGSMEWAGIFTQFHAMVSEHVQQFGGMIVKLYPDGLLAAFNAVDRGVSAAVSIQEAFQEQTFTPTLSLSMGIASGQAMALPISENHTDYFGACVEIAEELGQKARGHAILMNHPVFPPSDNIDIRSKAGERSNRPLRDYFVEQPIFRISGHNKPLTCYSVFWQNEPAHYLAQSPIEEYRPHPLAESHSERTYFGRVSAFKKERGFGFIQYYSEDDVYKEVYFHMTYVIAQVPIAEHDHVQFVVRPGKEERPQACSILVMGSRLRGVVESVQPDGAGFIVVSIHDSDSLRFFMLPRENFDNRFRVDDPVYFTVGSGSDLEGLVALDLESATGPGVVDDSEVSELPIGSIQQAVVNVYFSEKGYGFAKCRRSNIYVHVSELADPKQEPAPGDLIEFRVSPGRDSTYRANDIRVIPKKNLLV
ncbi:MAG: cold shock domain-containing protein [Magnetococcales bacterium]|nr:cold shock domain-containing protein [Magnetococcales bacterium]MBF0150947.1 cold shock domain-containing protein [Magnetococcales bacterium]MBF0172233.1 cold shock domain-containing protein [Magnetococcales bacterium]MBF0631552.1 cold shock domain-containing protein [Magnetococcales bacterium]